MRRGSMPQAQWIWQRGVAGSRQRAGSNRTAAVRRKLDMNFLMTVAILGAAVIGEALEAAAIAFLFSLAELLEAFSVERARASVEALMELAPETARLLRDGEEVVVPVEALAPGDFVAVRPGERIPADGTVVEGTSAVDETKTDTSNRG